MHLYFCEAESTFAYFAATRRYLEMHGKPVAFYSDKATVFRVNAKDPVGGDGFTQFGRAMHALNIDSICANTAAAKGRVERANLTLKVSRQMPKARRVISGEEAGRAGPGQSPRRGPGRHGHGPGGGDRTTLAGTPPPPPSTCCTKPGTETSATR